MENYKTPNDGLTNSEAFKIALETRNFEINLFWQRSNYFLILNAGLAGIFFGIKDNLYSIIFSIFGIIASFLWFRVNLGSKFWQSRWEYRLALKEKEINSNLNFFDAAIDIVIGDAKKSLKYNEENKSIIQKIIEKLILKKPSVSYQMILLSLLFTACWGLLLVIKFLEIIFECTI